MQPSIPLPQLLETMVLGGALNFLAAILILIVGWMIAHYAARWLGNALNHFHGIDATLKPLITSALKYGILAVTVMAVLERFGVQTTSIIAILGAAGLAIGLALQGTLSNVASGVLLLMLRPFRVREKISIPGVTGANGIVREVGLFRTTLVADDGEFISVPNTMIFSGAIINESREPTRRVNFLFNVDKAADIGKVQGIVQEILHKDSRILKNPLPAVLIDSITDTGISVNVQAWVLNPNFSSAKSDLKKAVRENLLAAHIQTPQQIVTLNSPLKDIEAEPSRRQRSA